MKSIFIAILFFFSTSILFSQVSNTFPSYHSHTSANTFISNLMNADTVYVEIPNEKSPWLAFGLSYIFPGIGQFYNGEVMKGLLFIGGITVGAGIIVLGAGDAEHKSSVSNGMVYSGAALAVICWIWQIIDAPVSASRINEERRTKLKKTEIEILPELSKAGFSATIKMFFN